MDLTDTHFPKARQALERYQPHLEYFYSQTRRQQQCVCIFFLSEEWNSIPHSVNVSSPIHISLNNTNPTVST